MSLTEGSSVQSPTAGKSSNSVQIEITDPQNHTQGSKKYTDYLVRTKTTLPIFTVKEFSVRRRFSDFEWLRTKIETKLKISPPSLPDKAWKRQIPFMKETLFDDQFVEERRRSLEHFITKISEHPLVQTEKIWVSFLQDQEFVKT